MTKAPSMAPAGLTKGPTIAAVEAKLGPNSVPEWMAHIIASLEGVVPASVWLDQFTGDWNDIPAIRDACDYACTYRWMSKDDFVKKLKDPDAVVDVPQQRMERFIVVEVLKSLSPKLDRSMVIKITRSLAANLMSHAFQRVSADYTWDRVVFDTIPFMVDFAEKMMVEVVPEPSTPDFPSRTVMSSDNSSKLYAWHLYIEMESMTARLSTARAVATEIVKKANGMPLHECCKGYGYVASDVAAILVVEHRQNGDAVRLTDSDGNSALHYATQRKEEDDARLIRVLYSAGAVVNARNNLGLTPMAFGCANAASLQAIEELLQLDASPKLVDNGGLTPLHYAIRVQCGNIVRLLSDHGVDLNAPDKDGFTPAHVAASAGSVCMLVLLASLGASLEESSKAGLTPLAVASRRHHLQAVLFLFQTRNHLAARHPDDPSSFKVLSVLQEQLPEVGKVPQITISGLGLDHLPAEIGYLRFTRQLDVRHNSLKTFWMTPWWWVPVFSRKANSIIQIVFLFCWASFVLAGIFTPSITLLGSPQCPYKFRIHHFYILLSVTIAAAFLVASLRSSFVLSNTIIEKKTTRFKFFRLNNYANLISLLELFIEQCQLSALAYSIDSVNRGSLTAKFFRAFLFDFGVPHIKIMSSISIILIYMIRVWIECRSFIPNLWSYDKFLMPFFSILYMPFCRSLMANFLEDMTDPTNIVLFLFGVGSLFSIIPMAIYGEVSLQARDGLRQIRLMPTSIILLRAFILVLVAVDIIMNQESVPFQRYEAIIACWLFPAALISSAILGKRVLTDETIMMRASPFWAALIHSICLVLRPKEMPETFALISWPICLAFLIIIVCLSRLKNQRMFTDQLGHYRIKMKRDAMFQCFRLHPRFDEIIRDFNIMDPAELQNKYDLDRWLRDRCPSNVQFHIVDVLKQIELNLPVYLPPL